MTAAVQRPVLDRLASRSTAFAAVVALLVGVQAVALLSDSATSAGTALQTDVCFRARVASVQNGTHTIDGDGVDRITVADVDPDRSFLLYSLRSSGTAPGDALVLGRLADATTVELERVTATAGAPTVDVAWTVVEYQCGVRVHRGATTSTGTSSLDVPIELTHLAQSFPLVSVVPPATETSLGAEHHLRTYLPDDTTLRVSASAPMPAGTRIDWQVVEFTRPGDAAVQRVSTSLPAGQATTTAALPTAVDPDRTIVLGGGSGALPTSGLQVVTSLESATSVRWRRTTSAQTATVQAWVVELPEGTTVARGQVTLVPGDPVEDATVSAVDLATSSVIGTSVTNGAAATGRTTHPGATLGEVQATFRLVDSRTVRVRRTVSTSTSVFGYQLVQWGGPSWWDTSWTSRQQLLVEGNGTDAPTGYTTSLTFDHAAMVALGDALASGDDVRILHFDGSTWTELDRVLDGASAWGRADTTIWLRTVDPVASDATDGTYWLYTGNPTPPAPADDPAAVWLVTDSFEDGDVAEYTDHLFAWYEADPWTRRVVLRVPAGTVDADLTDFPVYVEVTVPSLVGVAAPDGHDLRFTAADGATRLAHELVDHDGATGTVRAWVQLPTVSATTATTFHLYAGATNAPDQQDVRGTWDNGYLGVWHLDGDPAASLLAEDVGPDDLDGLMDAAGRPARVAGVGLGALDHALTDLGVDVGPAPAPRGALTISALVDNDALDASLVARGTAGADWRLALENTTGVPRLRATVATADGGGSVLAGAVTEARHVALRYDGTTLDALLDGVVGATTPVTGSLAATAGATVMLATDEGGATPLDGRLDEVRIAGGARSDAWLAAEAATARSPGTFVTVVSTAAGTFFDVGDWAARVPLHVDGAAVRGTPTGVAVLVEVATGDLVGAAQADGADLVVTADDGVTRLPHELEAYRSATGQVRLWVRVPTLRAGTDTLLYLYYGNPAATDQQDPTAVFADDAVVLHLDERPGVAP